MHPVQPPETVDVAEKAKVIHLIDASSQQKKITRNLDDSTILDIVKLKLFQGFPFWALTWADLN